jgi:hypothetical protein
VEAWGNPSAAGRPSEDAGAAANRGLARHPTQAAVKPVEWNHTQASARSGERRPKPQSQRCWGWGSYSFTTPGVSSKDNTTRQDSTVNTSSEEWGGPASRPHRQPQPRSAVRTAGTAPAMHPGTTMHTPTSPLAHCAHQNRRHRRHGSRPDVEGDSRRPCTPYLDAC